MARKRMLDPNFFADEKVVQVSAFARLMFQGLWCVADREGRLERKPLRLKMQLFPADNVDGEALISELETVGLVEPYEVDGATYLLIPGFQRHQHVHPKEAPSKLPAPRSMEKAPRVMDEPKARAFEPSMEVEPGKSTHETGVDPSDIQAFGYSRPSGPSEKQPMSAQAPPEPDRRAKVKAPRESDRLCEDFETLVGERYRWNGAKDGDAFAKLRREFSLDEIRARWRKGLAAPPGWHQIRSVAQLASKWNDLAGTGPGTPARDLRKPIPPATFTETRVVEDF